MFRSLRKQGLLLLLCLSFATNAFAASKTVDLSVEFKTMNFTGVSKQAITVNGKLPGPELHFKQGDQVVINVTNKLNTGTSIHWHGVLVPWQMDGVSGVTQQPIPPGQSLKYEFFLQQAGTYWYHSHTGLQVQEGLYGAFVIEPNVSPKYQYNEDFVIVLSDWSNTPAETIMANLQTNGNFYSGKYNLHNFNDVAYDAFLLNGKDKHDPWKQQVKVGDVVRLRFIGAGASTIFRVKIPQQKMQTVNIQGNDVLPYTSDDFIIAPGETQDVLIKIAKEQPYIIYAESLDQLGAAYGALLTAANQNVEYAAIKGFSTTTTKDLANKYAQVVAAVTTNDPNKAVDQNIKMELTGDMQQYIWSINGETGFQAKPIMLEPAKRYRITFTNKSMMPHPMHVHGHWFILRKGKGTKDPLLHTIVVAPKQSITADIDTDASGQWILHCHTLYHVQTGMYRILQYTTLPEILDGKFAPENIISPSNYINRPIVRVDEVRPLDAALIDHPEPS